MSRLMLRTAALSLALLTGCAHAVRLETNPPGAEVRLDGVTIGHTPLSFTDEGSTGHTYDVEIHKPGFRPQKVKLEQEIQGVRAGVSIVTGMVLAVPLLGLLWSWQLPENRYGYRLEQDAKPLVEAPAAKPQTDVTTAVEMAPVATNPTASATR